LLHVAAFRRRKRVARLRPAGLYHGRSADLREGGIFVIQVSPADQELAGDAHRSQEQNFPNVGFAYSRLRRRFGDYGVGSNGFLVEIGQTATYDD